MTDTGSVCLGCREAEPRDRDLCLSCLEIVLGFDNDGRPIFDLDYDAALSNALDREHVGREVVMAFCAHASPEDRLGGEAGEQWEHTARIFMWEIGDTIDQGLNDLVWSAYHWAMESGGADLMAREVLEDLADPLRAEIYLEGLADWIKVSMCSKVERPPDDCLRREAQRLVETGP